MKNLIKNNQNSNKKFENKGCKNSRVLKILTLVFSFVLAFAGAMIINNTKPQQVKADSVTPVYLLNNWESIIGSVENYGTIIITDDASDIPSSYEESFQVGSYSSSATTADNGAIIAYCNGYVPAPGETWATVCIYSENPIYAPIDSSYLFAVHGELSEIIFKNFNTSIVTNMSGMFSRCSQLTSLDLSGFNTSSVTCMDSMFYDCSGLTSLDLSSFDTSSVTNMDFMFSSCQALTSLDLSSFDTSNVTDMSSMFIYCSSLTTIYVDSSKWDTTSVSTSTNMFSGCTSLVGGNGTTYSSYQDKTYARVDASGTPGYLTEKPVPMVYLLSNWKSIYSSFGSLTHIYFVDDVADLPSGYSSLTSYQVGSNSISGSSADSGAIVAYYKEVSENSTTYKKLYFYSPNIICAPENSNSLFNYCSSLITLDLSNFNTSNVTNMSYMFGYCSHLTSLDLTGFNTSNVTSMGAMFLCSSALTSLNLSSFNTSNVTNMGEMFNSCSHLTSLNLSSFNTSSVTSMQSMFTGCSTLTSLNVSSFNTSNVTLMNSMFNTCSSLASLDISNFDTRNVIMMNDMFRQCSSFTRFGTNVSTATPGYLKIGANFSTAKNRDLGRFFYQCTNLADIDLSTFDTNKIDNVHNMFDSCTSLTTLDLSSFDTGNVEYFSEMFKGCSNLTTIYVDAEKWSTESALYTIDMFSGCTSLVGENGTVYDSSVVDGTYARIDEAVYSGNTYVSGNKGYFTEKVIPVYLLNTWKEIVYNSGNGEDFANIYAIITTNSLPTGYANMNSYDVGSNDPTASVATAGKVIAYISYDGNNHGTIYLYSPTIIYAPNNSSGLFGVKNLSYYLGGPVLVSDNTKLANIETINLSNFRVESNVISMRNMFYNCSGLTSLDLSNFNTSNVTNMWGMFEYCSSLTSLDLSSFNTSNVTSMTYMFKGCSDLTSLNLSSFNTGNVTDMSNMFDSCSGLTSLNISSFNTINVNNIHSMFAGCSNLTSLDLSNFNTKSVVNMGNMFSGCSGLTSLDLSSFNTSNVTSIDHMFIACSNLRTIYVDAHKWNISNVTSSIDMFYGCTSLVGGSGTAYKSSVVDGTYAVIDTTGKPGYLTLTGINNFPPSGVETKVYVFNIVAGGAVFTILTASLVAFVIVRKRKARVNK